ncbi:MAG: AraC family transcriptional regulator [Nitratireductor sp.]|nr:AraC family transcriptional regulator [Nitratireductor sp.]
MPGFAHATPEPLQAYRLFSTSDVDEARHLVSRSFCSHQMSCVGASRDFTAVKNRAAGRNLSLNYLRFGAEVEVNPRALDGFYLVQVPLRGSASISHGSDTVLVDEHTAAVLNPCLPTRLTWHAGCEQLILRIDSGALNALAETLIGHELARPVRFELAVDRRRPEIAEWMTLLQACVAAAQHGPDHWGREDNRHQGVIEEQLLTRLLMVQPSVISHFLSRRALPAAGIGKLCRARDFIHGHLRDPITLAQIARAAQCSIRGLQALFQQKFGCSPMQYLRNERLNMAHYLLQTAPDGVLVSDIAYDSGFSHLGRFAIAYREAFGQSPSLARGAGRSMGRNH